MGFTVSLEKMKLSFGILFMFLINLCIAETEDLYNTKPIITDLLWTLYPSTDGWEEVSGIYHGSPIRFYQVCNTDDLNTDNWARTPHIEARGAKRIYVEVEFSMMKCDPSMTKNCRETFNLYIYESDTDVASSTFPPWKENPYVKIDTIAAGQRFTSGDTDRGVNRKTWTLGPLKRAGFYIAAHDKGACMSLLSLRVYYSYCLGVTKALATFPKTVAGEYATSLVPVKGTCVGNSIDASPDGPLFHCNSNGDWKVRTGACQCVAGYQTNRGLTSCVACGSGQYKTKLGNHGCSSCPLNSISSNTLPSNSRSNFIKRLEPGKTGLAYCECLDGFYRAPDEDVHQPCTKPPTKPINLEVRVNETWVKLSWSEPEETGGRVDIFYKVSCYRCKTNKYLSCGPCVDAKFLPKNSENILDTKTEIRNLNAFTHYKFRVYAASGVTSQTTDTPEYTEVQVMTNQAIPSKVVNVRAVNRTSTQLTIMWSPPIKPNGNVLGFELSIVETNRLVKQEEDLGNMVFVKDPLIPIVFETTNHSITVTNLKHRTQYSVKVRAKTAAGFGDFSELYITNTMSRPESSLQQEGGKNLGLLGAAAAVAAMTVIMIFAVIIYLRKRRKEKSKDNSDEEKFNPDPDGQLVVNLPDKNHKHSVYVEYADPYKAVTVIADELGKGQIIVEGTIGQGEFGEVFCGKLKTESGSTKVAIKQLKQGASLKDQVNFLREASTMAQFDHPNVLKLKGVVTKSHPFMIVSEFMSNGSLDVYLRLHQNQLELTVLLEMLRGIASGMRYLSEMQYVHRDLAARNILVDEDFTCKVSDFGLSRTFENDPNSIYTTQGGKIALRWTAPESIKYREFNPASDVWSFGILIWEVMSYGQNPYWEMTNQDVIESIDDGYRLPRPTDCPPALHQLMINCWAYNEQQRPKFSEIKKQIDKFISDPDLVVVPNENDGNESLSIPVSPIPSE